MNEANVFQAFASTKSKFQLNISQQVKALGSAERIKDNRQAAKMRISVADKNFLSFDDFEKRM